MSTPAVLIPVTDRAPGFRLRAPSLGGALAVVAGLALPLALLAVLRPQHAPRTPTQLVPLPSLTLLDEAGRLAHAVPAQQVAAWKQEATGTRPARSRLARLHVLLGEYELAHNEEPGLARWHFWQAKQAAAKRSADGALAEYDTAIALYRQGAYPAARDRFGDLLRGASAAASFSRRDCALWYRHAAACAGYHTIRENAGITEPPQLDPLCGVAGLAVWLRAEGLPYAKTRLVKACRHTGEGSNFADLMAACARLGVSGHVVSADEKGLTLVPKPVVAYVEHDHFIAVVRAGPAGVSYVCSDCGAWPGGRVDLTWEQWRLLDPGMYLAVAKRGSQWDTVLQSLPTDRARALRAGVKAAAVGPTAGLQPGMLRQTLALLAQMQGHVVQDYLVPFSQVACGSKMDSLHCITPFMCCLKDCGGVGGGRGAQTAQAVGASAGDPVNLATGEEEYSPAADMVVYNPVGPSVVWQRTYNSLRGPNQTYQSDDLGVGWSQPYNFLVYEPQLAINTQLVQATATTLSATGSDGPGAGLTWDILRNGTVVATSSAPGGWSVTSGGYLYSPLTITVPASAPSATGYEVRFLEADPYYGSQNQSLIFDVLPPATAPQAGSAAFGATGGDAPAGGQHWDVVLNGAVVATAANPGGWTVAYDPAYTHQFTVTAPWAAAVSSAYEVRFQDAPSGYTYTVSAPFAVASNRYYASGGSKYVILPNGARVSFTAPSAPTAAQPQILCTPQPGAAMLVQWDYDAGNPFGHYVITFRDRMKWVTTTYSKVVGNSALCYSLSRLVDRNGNAMLFNYGASGPSGFPLLSSIADGANNPLLTITRSAGTGSITSVSDRYGRSIYYHVGSYATANVPPAFAQAYQEVDSVSQIVPTGTASPPMRYQYGYQNVANGEGSEAVPFLHTIGVPSPTGAGVATATINYDPTTGFVSSCVDANGNTRAYTPILGSNQTKVTVTNPQGTVAYSYTGGFDNNMNPTSITDGTNTNALATKAYSDPNDPFVPSSVTDATGRQVSATWDAYGNPQTMASARGIVTTYTWDYSNFPLGELVSAQEGSKAPQTIEYYEPSGLIRALHYPAPDQIGGAPTETTTRTYDGLGNLLTETLPGNNSAGAITVSYSYTSDGNYTQGAAIGQTLTATDGLGRTTHYRYDAQGNQLSETDALGNTTQATYDIANSPVMVTYPGTSPTGALTHAVYAYAYPGGPVTGVTAYDEDSGWARQTVYAYGREGELLSSSGMREPCQYTYDAQYRAVAIADGRSHATTYMYNTAGNLATMAYPGANGATDTEQYTRYDAEGRALAQIDGRGLETDYTYDVDGQLLSKQYPAVPSLNVTFGYDSYGRRTSRSESAGSVSVSYSDTSAVLATTATYAGLPARGLSFAHYPDGSRQSMTTPAGTFTYTYDQARQLVGMSNPANEVFGWTYLANGWLWTQALPNGVTTAYTYNARGLVTDIQTRGGGATLSDFGGIVYDGGGNRLSVSATVSGSPSLTGQTSYAYDSRDHLTREQSTRGGGYTELFAYDDAGNPTTFRGAARTYNADNQDTRNTYDGEGNPVVYAGTSLTFDALDRLTAVGATFTAGYMGRARVWKQGAGGKTYFLYDGTQPVCELDASGAVLASNTFGMAGLAARRAGGASVFCTFDATGSVAQRLDGGGNVLSSAGADAYGSLLTPGAPPDPFSGFGGKWGYYTDVETGLQLLGQRYYDSGAGRFLTRDPIGMAGGINVYAYARSNPVTRIDTSGDQENASDPRQWCEHDSAIHEGLPGDGEAGPGLPPGVGGGGTGDPAAPGLTPSPAAPIENGNPGGSAPTPGLRPGPVIAGHGILDEHCGTFLVPEGTYITFYCPEGHGVEDAIGRQIEAGYYEKAAAQFCETFGPGDEIPNYEIWPPDDLVLNDPFDNNTITVHEPTQLCDILEPNKGTYHAAFCRRWTF